MMMFHDADVDPFGDHLNFDIASSEALVWSSMHFLPILTALATIKRNIAMFNFTKKQNPHILRNYAGI